MAACFVANVKGFSAWIAHWIVAPGSEAELVRIFAPRVSGAALGDDGSKRSVRYYIHPRRWRHLVACRGDDVLAPIRCESPEAVEENQPLSLQGEGGGISGQGAA